MLAGIGERMAKQLTHTPSTMEIEVAVAYERKCSDWMWTSKREHVELGPTIVHKKQVVSLDAAIGISPTETLMALIMKANRACLLLVVLRLFRFVVVLKLFSLLHRAARCCSFVSFHVGDLDGFDNDRSHNCSNIVN